MSSVALPGRSSPQDRGAPGGGGRGDGQGDGQKADDASDGESSDDGELDIIVYVKKPNEQVPLKVATCIDHSVAIFKGLVKKVAAVPRSQQVLDFNGTTLEDTRSLRAYGITDGARVLLKFSGLASAMPMFPSVLR